MEEKLHKQLQEIIAKGRGLTGPAVAVQGVYALGVLETLVSVVYEMGQEIEKLKANQKEQ